MTGREAFKIWAPYNERWTDWVRPVPFMGAEEDYDYFNHTQIEDYNLQENTTPENYLSDDWLEAALIVDLPGYESVEEGIALTKYGFRPIPIFNGTFPQKGARATVDNQSVGVALLWGAKKLQQIEIKKDAPPAFLLDKQRLHRFKLEIALFDNSWDVYPQDLPTGDYFLQHGIRKILVVSDNLSKDLKKILYTYQKKGVQIWWTDGLHQPKKKRVFKSFF